ncbi:MAG: YqgE/AlgH family protein [Bacteroidia bacterium]|nr:YqgE/AlgH family protein [Bacteroidia bacterium]MBT8228646.1 YqgE/AlgH family protein [Bacteroidia bacterium]
MSKKNLSSGKILIAEPFMMDPNFKRSVICLCEHSNAEGSLGFILNKPINIKLNDLIKDIPTEEEFKVYYGGPVATNTIHYLHNVGDILEESVPIKPGLFWGGDYEKLKFFIETGLVKPNNIRFYIGYSGWSPGQLEDEMQYGSWVPGELFPNYVFKTKSSRLWTQSMENKGNTYAVIAQMPKGISLN